MNTAHPKLVTVVRICFGALLALTGLAGLLQLAPQTEVPPQGGEFLAALAATGYMIPLIKLTELVCGILLIANLFVPLALVVVAPVVLNIVAFHAVLAPSGLWIALAMLAAELLLAWQHRKAFAPLFQRRAEPTARRSGAQLDERSAATAV